MIIRKIPYFEFEDMILEPVHSAAFLNGKFYLSFPVPKAAYLESLTQDTVLFEVPGAFTLKVVKRSYTDQNPEIGSMRSEGCFYFNEKEEWILEAVCSMRTADDSYSESYCIRLPLSAPFAKEGELGFYFDGTWFYFVKDGQMLNKNAGLDCFAVPAADAVYAPEWENAFTVGNAEKVKVSYKEEAQEGNADFYSPRPWNAFAGDVMNFYHDGVYHLLYLKDRRHHGSRNGGGAHEIYQLTSKDLVNWTEEVPVAPITAPWMSFGTGTMLYHKGKYYMVYGYHTERYKGAQEKVECRIDPEEKVFPLLSCEEILNAGKVPAGASFSVSDDGIHFEPAGVLYHPGRNPSTYAMPDGSVRVYAGYMGNGVWESEGFDKPFRLSKEDFSFIGSSVMKNSSECPSFFEWNGYKYLVIGFTGYYRTLSVDSAEYVDMAGKEEFYDGLCVPMITSFGENRRLIAGWLNGIGWGSVIIHRELLQEESGRLGMKWVPEMIPQTIGENLLPDPGTVKEKYSVLTQLEKDSSYLLELTVDPKAASCIKLQFADKEKAAELTLDLTGQRMQIMDTQAETEAEKLPTSYEFAAALNGAFDWHIPGQHIAYSSKNFCMADIFGMDGPFTLKVLIRSSKKMRSTVLDVEVAQRRTLVSVRPGLFADRILVAGDCAVTESSLKKLK